MVFTAMMFEAGVGAKAAGSGVVTAAGGVAAASRIE